jgi:hypothetical protein
MLYSFEEVGVYNLVCGAVTLSIYVAGMEFYYYSNRLLVTKEGAGNDLFSSQIGLYAINYLFLAFPIIWWFNGYGIGLVALGYLISYHLNLEISRILIYLKKPIFSSLILGIGQGVWVLPILGLCLLDKTPSLSKLLTINTAFMLIGLFIGLRLIKDQCKFSYKNVNFYQIINGIKITLPLTFGVLAYKGLEFLGRFWLEHDVGLEAAGIFSYFQNISYLIVEVVYVAIIAIDLPNILINKEQNSQRCNNLIRKMFFKIVILSFVLLVGVGTGVPIFANIINKVEVYDHSMSFIIIATGYSALNIAAFYGAIMYVEKNDTAVAILNLSTALVGVVLMFFFVKVYSLEVIGAAVAFLGWAIAQVFVKYTYLKMSSVI